MFLGLMYSTPAPGLGRPAAAVRRAANAACRMLQIEACSTRPTPPHRDLPCRLCAETGLASPTSAPGPGWPACRSSLIQTVVLGVVFFYFFAVWGFAYFPSLFKFGDPDVIGGFSENPSRKVPTDASPTARKRPHPPNPPPAPFVSTSARD